MLIYLTNSLIVDDDDERLGDIKRCAKYLALAMIEHNHLIRGDYDVLKWLSKIMVGFDEDSVKVYMRLYKRFSTYVIPSCLHFYIEVVVEMPSIDCVSHAGVKVKPVHYTYFLNSSKVQIMPFIGEDTADCIFYIHIGKHYLAEHHINLLLRLRNEKGNGSGIVSATTEYVQAHKPVISIIDSDKKYPSQPIDPKSTYAKCNEVWSNYNKVNEIFSFLVVETQEIENLIPYNYIDELDLWEGQCSQNKVAFDKLYNSPNCEVILCYYDLKNGLTKKDDMNTDGDFLDYAVMCSSCLDENCTKDTIKATNNNYELCPRLHRSLLKKTNEYIQQHELLHPVLLRFQQREWDRIGAMLLDMCCAGKEAFV